MTNDLEVTQEELGRLVSLAQRWKPDLRALRLTHGTIEVELKLTLPRVGLGVLTLIRLKPETDAAGEAWLRVADVVPLIGPLRRELPRGWYEGQEIVQQIEGLRGSQWGVPVTGIFITPGRVLIVGEWRT